MNQFKEPFQIKIFTLSSHHPYNIPAKYKGRFHKGNMENLESIGYADYCLRLFFQNAQKSKWFNNTLFILTADHCSLSEHPYFKHTAGLKSIPILFYKSDNSLKGKYSNTFSQIDILPTALQIIGYNKPFYSLGKSSFNRNNNNCYYYENGSVYVVNDSMLYIYNKTKLNCVYNLKQDSFLHKNIIEKIDLKNNPTDIHFKAFIQTNNNTLLENNGIAKKP
jgi:phosphoglycerol transferase MdoB-like AlkP superfamily enzyme